MLPACTNMCPEHSEHVHMNQALRFAGDLAYGGAARGSKALLRPNRQKKVHFETCIKREANQWFYGGAGLSKLCSIKVLNTHLPGKRGSSCGDDLRHLFSSPLACSEGT
eukprot:1158310-Pelagomonas_calceolata.AAC.10